jgi:UDP-2,4-diacetamido-2,4,6-trideoxy-beta-L-altropyranose hydrolase
VKIVIRTDASIKMGSGHVMRCLTLAEELNKNGFDITFISRAHEGNLNGLISDKGMKVVELSAPDSRSAPVGNGCSDDYAEWLGVTREQDVRETINVLGKTIPDWLIVDHYGLDESWEKTIRSHVKKIMVIDDLANRHHDCEMLLDQNWFDDKESRYKGLVPAGCTLFLGPEYALLRPEFSEARKTIKPRNDVVKRIFVFFGGSDPHKLTKMTLRALCESELSHLEVDVVIGQNNPQKSELKELCLKRPLTHLHIQVDEMASIMVKADLAIGSGGVNTWERICLNLFSFVVMTASNQESTINDLNEYGYIKYLGVHKNITQKKIKNCIYKYQNKSKQYKLNEMIIDGMGVDKISRIIGLTI